MSSQFHSASYYSSCACDETDDSVLFINAGGSASEGCEPSSKLSEDSFFEGGDAIETSEDIVEGGDYPSLYHSARYGNFSYKIDGLAPGDYFLDLHFAEIVNTYGPKGIRAFDVLVQEENANTVFMRLLILYHNLFSGLAKQFDF